jgi:hypothetical protein
MLEIKIDLIPFGYIPKTKQIGLIKIWNDGRGTSELGDYGYEIIHENGDIIRAGEYKGFKRKDGVFNLLKEILNDAL